MHHIHCFILHLFSDLEAFLIPGGFTATDKIRLDVVPADAASRNRLFLIKRPCVPGTFF